MAESIIDETKKVQTNPKLEQICFDCGSKKNLWECYSCNIVSCSNGSKSELDHAQEHFNSTQHAYAMSVENGRAFDFSCYRIKPIFKPKEARTKSEESSKPANSTSQENVCHDLQDHIKSNEETRLENKLKLVVPSSSGSPQQDVASQIKFAKHIQETGKKSTINYENFEVEHEKSKTKVEQLETKLNNELGKMPQENDEFKLNHDDFMVRSDASKIPDA